MKKLLFIPALLFIAILFISCGGDKKPGDLPVQVKAAAEKTFPALVATEGVAQSVEVEFRVEDFPGVVQYKKWIKNADVPMSTTSTYIELKGISEEDQVELKNVTVSLASVPANQFSFRITTITNNEKFAADRTDRVTFMQAVMNEVVSKGSSKVVLKYTPGTTMINPNVKMTIRIDAEFFFN